MINLDCDNTIYDNLIEYYFHEYFELNNIDITGLNFKHIPNSTYKAAFSYVYKKLFKPLPGDKRLSNKNTRIDLQDINELNNIFNIYKELCLKYSIAGFQDTFSILTGISTETFNSWLVKEYDHGGLSQQYSDLVQNINSLVGQQVRTKLFDDRIGLQSLANNDQEVGLLYARADAFNKTLGSNNAMLSLSDLKNLKIAKKD